MREILKARAKASTWRDLGKSLGVSGQYLHAVANGRRVPAELAQKLGYRRVDHVTFVPLETDA